MNKSIAAWALLVVVATGSTGCKLFRKRATRQPAATTTPVPASVDTAIGGVIPATPTPAMNDEKARLLTELSPLYLNRIPWTSFSGRAKMKYEGKGDRQEFTANFRMRKDSVVWASITALGGIVNVAKALITPDSVKVVNYLQKEVYLMPMSQAGQLLPAAIDFKTLQDFIVGNALLEGGTPTDATDFGGSWSVQLENREYIQQLTFNKADSTLRTSQLKARAENGPAVMTNYGDYRTTPRRFAGSRMMMIQNGAEQHRLEMEFNDGVNWDQVLEFNFSVPSRYKVK